jgi:hypothetical protein
MASGFLLSDLAPNGQNYVFASSPHSDRLVAGTERQTHSTSNLEGEDPSCLEYAYSSDYSRVFQWCC